MASAGWGRVAGKGGREGECSEGMRRIVAVLHVARLVLEVRVTLQVWQGRCESAVEEQRQQRLRVSQIRARWLATRGNPELAARVLEVRRMRACITAGEWVHASMMFGEWDGRVDDMRRGWQEGAGRRLRGQRTKSSRGTKKIGWVPPKGERICKTRWGLFFHGEKKW